MCRYESAVNLLKKLNCFFKYTFSSAACLLSASQPSIPHISASSEDLLDHVLYLSEVIYFGITFLIKQNIFIMVAAICCCTAVKDSLQKVLQLYFSNKKVISEVLHSYKGDSECRVHFPLNAEQCGLLVRIRYPSIKIQHNYRTGVITALPFLWFNCR